MSETTSQKRSPSTMFARSAHHVDLLELLRLVPMLPVLRHIFQRYSGDVVFEPHTIDFLLMACRIVDTRPALINLFTCSTGIRTDITRIVCNSTMPVRRSSQTPRQTVSAQIMAEHWEGITWCQHNLRDKAADSQKRDKTECVCRCGVLCAECGGCMLCVLP